MKLSVVRIALGTVLVAILIVAVGVYAVIATPLFKGYRQSVAQKLVAEILGRPAVVEGNVSVAFDKGIKVAIESIDLPPDESHPAALADQFIDYIEFVLPYSALGTGTSGVSRFHMSGIQIELGNIRNPGLRANRRPGTGLGLLVSSFLNSDLSDDLLVMDVLVRYRDSANGWDEELRIKELVSSRSDGGEFVEIGISADINGTALTSSARVRSVRFDPAETELPFEIRSTSPGAESHISGTLDISGEMATINGDVRLQSASIGQMLDDLGLERTIDGTLTVKSGLNGPLDRLQATAIELDANSRRGDKISISGDIADISAGDGIALDFSVAFADDAQVRTTENILDLEVVGFHGHLEGAVENLSLSETVIRTNVASVGLADIGPISVGRLVKDDRNRLGLQDVHVQNGPPERPTLQIEGNIGDLLGFSSVKLDGTLDIPVRSILGAKPVSDTGQFGRFFADVTVSDEGGALGISRLDGRIIDTDIWNLAIALAVGEFRHLDDIVLDTNVDIPDAKSLATAIGASVDADGGLSFDGHLLLSEKTLEFRGDATVIDTDIGGRLALTSTEGRGMIVGTLQSDHVRLPDLAIPIRFFSVRAPANVDLEVAEDIRKKLRVALDLDFRNISNGGKDTGKLAGHLDYADEIVSLAPFELGYLGGLISGDFTGDFRDGSPAYEANVRVRKWQMGRLLAELGLRAPLTGTVYIDVELKARGRNRDDWIRTTNGYLTASLWGGRVPGRLLDLTGLNLVSWLFAERDGRDGTKILCAVAPVRFTQGVANGRKMILETENVQIVGGGRIDFNTGALQLEFAPRPKKRQLINIVTPFRINGTFSSPLVKLEGGGKAGRATAEIIASPFNLVGRLLTGDKLKQEGEKPCVLPTNSKPK